MSLFTSSQFASTAAHGKDWREASKAVLEQLGDAAPRGHDFNFGFLFVSDHLADDAESILNLFKSVLKIKNWVGGIGIGVCASGEPFIDVPAISAMIGRFEDGAVQLFPPINLMPEDAEEALKPWLKEHDPMLVLAMGDPMSEEDPALLLQNLETLCGGFMVGGLSSSRQAHAQFSENLYQGGLCGAAFSQDIPVASMLSQGCTIVGDVHTVTGCEGHDLITLNDQPALEVFENALRTMVIKKIDTDPDTILVDDDVLKNPEKLPEEFHNLIQGEVHAALLVPESDAQDYLVRNIIGIDSDTGAMVLSAQISRGDRLVFVHRDHDSVYEDLSTQLLALRKRVQKQAGDFAPKGALYISCAARAFQEFEQDHTNEMQLIQEIIGDIPLTGFYAGGEINKGRLYGYSGILTLFL